MQNLMSNISFGIPFTASNVFLLCTCLINHIIVRICFRCVDRLYLHVLMLFQEYF